MSNLHVKFDRKHGDWIIKADGDKSWLARRPKKKEAIMFARAVAIERGCKVLIHNKG